MPPPPPAPAPRLAPSPAEFLPPLPALPFCSASHPPSAIGLAPSLGFSGRPWSRFGSPCCQAAVAGSLASFSQRAASTGSELEAPRGAGAVFGRFPPPASATTPTSSAFSLAAPRGVDGWLLRSSFSRRRWCVRRRWGEDFLTKLRALRIVSPRASIRKASAATSTQFFGPLIEMDKPFHKRRRTVGARAVGVAKNARGGGSGDDSVTD